jgi:hypothetical protein
LLRGAKKASSEVKAKSEKFIRTTEVDMLKEHTINDAIMSMIYSVVASNGRETRKHLCSGCSCCQSFSIHQERSPYISFTGELSTENTRIYDSWCELVEILNTTSRELEPIREFRSAVEICEKLRIDYSKVPLNMDNFNKNLQKLQVASRIAGETHKLVSTTQESIKKMLTSLNPYRHIHTVATQAKENRCFTPSQIVSRYWPDQSRVLGKFSQGVLRMNLVPATVDAMSRPTTRFYEESKQIKDNFTCLSCHELIVDAVKLSCCSTLMCEKCSTHLNGICPDPNCGRKFVAKPAIHIRGLIGNSPWRWACGHSTSISEMKSHLERCPRNA